MSVNYVATSGVTETERVIRRFRSVGLQFYWHMSLTGLNYSELRFCMACHLLVMRSYRHREHSELIMYGSAAFLQLTDDACLSS